MSEIWFTSDWHLGHVNVIGYSGRPFGDVDEMNDALVERHNDLVADDDIVYVLGDVAMGKRAESLQHVQRFRGRLQLIAGNHDHCWGPLAKPGKEERHARMVAMYLDAGFDTINDAGQLTVSGRHVLLSHFPYAGDSQDEDRYLDARPADRGAWLVHGHVHEAWRQRGRQINAGVDAWNYRPVHVDEIAELMAAGPRDLDRIPPA